MSRVRSCCDVVFLKWVLLMKNLDGSPYLGSLGFSGCYKNKVSVVVIKISTDRNPDSVLGVSHSRLLYPLYPYNPV